MGRASPQRAQSTPGLDQDMQQGVGGCRAPVAAQHLRRADQYLRKTFWPGASLRVNRCGPGLLSGILPGAAQLDRGGVVEDQLRFSYQLASGVPKQLPVPGAHSGQYHDRTWPVGQARNRGPGQIPGRSQETRQVI